MNTGTKAESCNKERVWISFHGNKTSFSFCLFALLSLQGCPALSVWALLNRRRGGGGILCSLNWPFHAGVVDSFIKSIRGIMTSVTSLVNSTLLGHGSKAFAEGRRRSVRDSHQFFYFAVNCTFSTKLKFITQLSLEVWLIFCSDQCRASIILLRRRYNTQEECVLLTHKRV